MISWRRTEEMNMKNLLSLFVVISFSTKAFGAVPYFDTFPSTGNVYPRLTDDSLPGTFYYTFKAKDPDGLQIIYSLENKITDWLEIVASNGTTTVKKKIDREAMLSIKDFRVYATDTNNEEGQLRVILQFTDVNNKPPIMTNIPKTINITELTTVDSELYTVLYEDKDDQINQQTEIFIHGGNEDGVFRMVNYIVYLNKSLDYDNGKRQYVLNITAKNTQPPKPQTTGTLTINVLNADDLGLNFTKKSYKGEVIKGSAIGTPIVRVDANDLDNLGEKAEYEIFPDSNKGNLYKIDSSSGEISVNGQLDLGSQTLVVTANSKKHGPAITFVTITVVAVRSLQFDASVSEGQQNVVVMDLSTIEDSFNVSGASFAIQSGNNGNHFVLVATELKVGSVALDRENIPNYSIVVKLAKNTTVAGFATIKISVGDVNDNSPHFEPSSYNVSLNEDLPVGNNVVKVTANDPDYGLNGTVKYAILTHQDLFSIDNSTGQVTLSKSLDHEKTISYVVLVQAYDGGTQPRTNSTNVTINILDINDNSPSVLPAFVSVNVNENAKIGFEVSNITATDADEGQNAKISYSILSGAQGHFGIDPNTGVITTLAQLSHKQNPNYQIVVAAMDEGSSPRSTNVFVLISVVAVQENNFKPIFKTQTYLGGIYKNTEFGKEILTISAEDGDSGSNGEVQYKIISGGDLFFLDPKSGKLMALQSLSDNEDQQYSLTVQATDRGSSPKVSEPNAMVHVIVLKESHSVAITAGVSKEYLLTNLQEFRSALDGLTDGKAFIKSVSQGSAENISLVLVNVVDNKDSNDFKEKDYESIIGTLGSKEKQELINGKYEKWRIQYGRPKTSARTSAAEGGMSAVVGAVLCLSVMIGVGGILMIVILIKKKRERQRVRKAARVTFNDKPQFIDPVGKSISRKIENAQEAQEVIVHMDDESLSEVSDEIDNSELKYYNDGYDDNNDDEERSENFYMDGDNVNFSTFLPPPPTHPPPAVPKSDESDSSHESQEESMSTDNEDEGSEKGEYMQTVLPPHQDFADPTNDYEELNHYNESPTHSVTDSTTNLVDPSSYKNSLLHDPSFGFEGGLRASINKDLTTEL